MQHRIKVDNRKTTGIRMGFDIGKESYNKFLEMADFYEASNKKLFVALIDQAYTVYEAERDGTL
jgi:hypothetical protein